MHGRRPAEAVNATVYVASPDGVTSVTATSAAMRIVGKIIEGTDAPPRPIASSMAMSIVSGSVRPLAIAYRMGRRGSAPGYTILTTGG